MTWHDPLQSGPVKYILDPPRGLFGLSDSLILEVRAVLYDSQSPILLA